jgi:hypothetical protein
MPGAQAIQEKDSVIESAGKVGAELMANSTHVAIGDAPAASLLDQERTPLQLATAAPQGDQEGAKEPDSTLGQPSVPVAPTHPITAAQGDRQPRSVDLFEPKLFERDGRTPFRLPRGL